MRNTVKATGVLIMSAAGAVMTLPTIAPMNMSAFSLGLLNHGLIAATIGGLADWFGTSALTRKPLGIGFHTNILLSNRERITNTVAHFISHNLLNANNLINNLQAQNTAALLCSYLQESGGRSKMKVFISDTLLQIALSIDTKALAKALAPMIKAETAKLNGAEIVQTVINTLTSEQISRKVLAIALNSVQDIYKSEVIQSHLKEKLSHLRKDYEADSPGRALVLNAMDLSDERILSLLNEQIDKKISGSIKSLTTDLVDKDSMTSAANMTAQFKKFLQAVINDEQTQKFIEDLKTVLAAKFNPTEQVKTWLDKQLKTKTYFENQDKLNAAEKSSDSHIIKLEKVTPPWQNSLDTLLDTKIDEFLESPVLQDKFDRFVKKLLTGLINEHHSSIDTLVRDKLNSFSDKELTEFVEDKVYEDLQMIRINGSLCGGIVGIILYLIQYAVTLAVNT